MKRIFILSCAALLFGPVLDAQESTPARPPMEQQGPSRPEPWSSNPPPAHEAIPISVPVAPPKPNGPAQKRVVRITASSLGPDYKASWNAGRLGRGAGAGFV